MRVCPNMARLHQGVSGRAFDVFAPVSGLGPCGLREPVEGAPGLDGAGYVAGGLHGGERPALLCLCGCAGGAEGGAGDDW